MKNISKRLLSLAMVIAMVLSMMPTTVFATDATGMTAQDLAAALAAGGEVKLSNDIELSEMLVVPSGVTVTLDLNGHAITVPEATSRHIYALNNKGVLTIKDSKGTGSVAARGIYNGYNGSNTDETVAGAKMIIESGTFYGMDANGGAAIFNCAELVINGGTFDGQVAAVNTRAKGVATIHSGTFRSVNNYAIQNNGGTVTIHNATVDRGFGAVGCYGGTTTINDGTYLPTGMANKTCHVVYVAAGADVTINDGTFKMNYPEDAVPDSGSAVASYYNGTLKITGGDFTAHFDNVSPVELSTGSEITGGTYKNHAGVASTHSYVTNFVKDGYELSADGTVSVGGNVVAVVNGTTYETFAEALAAAKTLTGAVTVEIYEKVTLNSSLSGSFDSIKFVGKEADAEVYLDVQGYITATGKKVAFEDLTLSKAQGGFIANAGFMNVAFGIYDVAEVTYTNCTFANGAYAGSGKVTYTGCTFQKSWEKYGLWAYGDVDVTVDGCTFDNDRGIKMFAEGAAKVTNLTVKDSDFSKLTGKPAIVLTYGESVVLEGNTYSSTGTFELDLDGAPNGTAVTSDVAPTCKNDNGACGVLVDGKIYTTVAQAAAVATEGNKVTLLHDSTETVELAEGVILDKNGFTAADVTVKVSYVAEVNGEKFETLEAAFAAAAEGDTIKLLADFELSTSIEIAAGKEITLDLNGKTVNAAWENEAAGKHIYALKNYGALTITDSVGGGSINSRGIYNYGNLILESGTINAIDGNGGYAVNNQSGSTFIMNGGVLATTNEDDHQSSSGGFDATALKVPAGATATLNGGKIVSVSDFTYAVEASGTLNIPAASTIEISGAHGAIAVQGGKTTIDAGTFSVIKDNYVRTDNVLYVSGGELVINGGTFTGDDDTASGGSCVYDAAGAATINGGSFAGSSGGDVWGATGTTIKGGTFENLTETQHIADGYELKNGSVVEAAPTVVEVDTLDELLAALADTSNDLPIVVTAEIKIPAGATVVLDLNGKTVTSVYQTGSTSKHIYPLNVCGNLTIQDTKGNGSISGRGIFVQAGSKLTIESGSIYAIDSNGGSALYMYGGDVVINGGHIEQKAEGTYNFAINGLGGTITVNGGWVGGNHGAIATEAATVVINGGTLVCTGTAGMTDNVVYSYSSGTITINGGNFIADNDGPAGGTCVYDANGGVTINGGTFGNSSGGDVWGTTGTTIKGGTFENLTETQHIAEGYELKNGSVVESKVYVAEVNGEKFESFEDAIAYANTITDGVANVTLLQDVTYGGGAINTNVVLDLNGKTITATGSYVFMLNPGTLTVKDSSAEKTGMIDGTETVGNVFIVYGGALTIESGKIHANNNVIFTYQSSSVITINGGELKSVIATGNILYLYEANTTTTVNGGTFYGPVACYAGTLKVAGGTFATDVSAYCAYGKTTKLVDGMYHIVDAEKNIYIGENSYLTLEDALNAAKDGDVIEIRAAGSYQLKRGALQEGAYYLPKNLTIKGTVDGVVVTNGPTIRCESIKLDNIDFINPSTSGTSSGLVFQISGNSQITNCTMDGYWGGSYYSLVNGSLVIDNCVIKGAVYGLNISENYDSDITITNTEISGWTSFAGDYNVVLDGCNLTHNGNYGYLGFHGDARIKNCTFGEGMEIGYMAEGITLYIDNSTAANGASVEGILEAGVGEKYDVYLDGVLLGDVELPEIQIIDIKGSLKDTDPDLTFALNFAIKNPDSLTEAYLEKLFAIYGGYYVDYVLTISGLNGGTVTFNANGDSDGYLAGQYDAWSENWLPVPFEDVVVKDGEGLYIMEYAAKLMNKQGLRFTLAEVAEIVQNFDCGVYFTPEFLAEHPDLKVSLQLKVFTEDAQGNKIENIDVATNNFENNYAAVVCGENKQSAYYATFAEAYAAAQAGDTIELLADVTLTGKLTVDKAITIDGNGHSLIAGETATWYTGSGFKKTYTHIVGVNSNNVTLKNVVIDCNSLSNGVNIYQVDGIVLDNVSIINSKYGYYALTVNDSSVAAKTALTIKTTTGAIDISKGDSSMVMEAGTVTDLGNKTVFFDTTGAVDLSGAVKSDGTVYFVAKDNAYYYTEKQIENRTTAFSNGLTLLSDIELANKAMEVKSTLNLNGYDLTVKTLKVSGSLAVIGDGNINGEVLLTKTTATVTTDKTLTTTSGVEGYVVDYADGVYKLVVAANDVAENVQTGVTYTDLQEALSVAAKGETVKLLKDVTVEGVYVGAGKTLDLNGNKLTVTDYASASFKSSHIIDSTNGSATLVLAEGTDYAFNPENAQLVIWTAEGLKFVDVNFDRALDMYEGNPDKAYFRFAFDEAQVLLDQILANGSEGTGLTIRIKVDYVTASGMQAHQYYEYTSDMVEDYYNDYTDWRNAMFTLVLSGVENLSGMVFTAEIASTAVNGTQVVVGSEPIYW